MNQKADLIIEKVQAAFFSANINLPNKISAAAKAIKAMPTILDGEPTILPLPDDAPLEIPRILLTSNDKAYSCRISLNRLDLTYQSKEENYKKDQDKVYKEFLEKIFKVSNLFFNDLKGNAGRLGVIINYRLELEIEGLEFLRKEILKKAKGEQKEIQVHNLLVSNLGDFKVNNWVRLRANKDRSNILWVVSDINVVEFEEYNITKENAENFFSKLFQLSKGTVLNQINL